MSRNDMIDMIDHSIDSTGQRFGKWTVLRFSYHPKGSDARVATSKGGR